MLDASEPSAAAAPRGRAPMSRFWWLWPPIAALLALFFWPQAFPASYRAWVGGERGALGSFYIAGEEASWDQHYLGWETPKGWRELNDQNETNLHETSSWLDQKPRALLELGVIVGGIATPLAALRWPAIRRARSAIVLPPFLCLPSEAIEEAMRMSGRALSTLAPGTTLFERASEVQELYFYLFILLYLIALRRRLREAPQP
jgi:hypothetical protein